MVKSRDLKYFIRDAEGVSEVIGNILLAAIAIFLLSTLAAAVYGLLGMNDVPHVEVQEKVNTSCNRIKIEHAGGEAIELDSVKITLYHNGNRYVFLPSDPDFSCDSENGAWKFGNSIILDTDLERGINMEENDSIGLYLIHTGSQQVLHKVRLSDAWKS